MMDKNREGREMIIGMQSVNLIEGIAVGKTQDSNKVYRVKLTKLRSTHERLGGTVLFGLARHLPKVGHSFLMLVESGSSTTRTIKTTTVQVVENIENEYEFHTTNSSYRLQVLEVLDGQSI